MIKYYLVPVLLSILFFVSIFIFSFQIVDRFADFVFDYFNLRKPPTDDSTWEQTKGIMLRVAEVGGSLILKGAILYLWMKINKYVVLIVLSPLFAIISEKTDTILTGTEFKTTVKEFISDIFRGVRIAIRNFFIEMSLIILGTILSFFVPLLSPFIALFLFIVSAYYYGFSMMDYIAERRRMNIKESVRFIRQRKGMAIGNGTAYLVLAFIPFLGIIFAPIMAAVSATISVCEEEEASVTEQ